MTLSPVLCLLVFGLGLCFANMAEQEPLVRTAQGSIRGELLTTYTGKKFYSFRGVRYAEPPIGPNRFKPPVQLKPWEGVYNATGDNPNSKMICPQPFPEELSTESGEDCLFLNVYTKQLEGNKPVMFFIHPGGYSSVTGNSEWFGPEYLLDKDVVLVVINYRLGALGFLSMQDKLLKGNYGMKDQVAALRWVKENIGFFGGNPNSVTIFGYSAGGSSLMFHMLSPMSKGLFHRGIAMSGSATMGWAMNREPISIALRLAKSMKCQGTTPQAVFNCLKDLPAQGISNGTIELKDVDVLYPIAFFAPVVEKDYGDGEERFLTEDPWELIKKGEFNSVPLITGVTKDEFAARGLYVLSNATLTEDFDTNFETVFPIEFMYERHGRNSHRISQELRKFYFGDKPIDNSTKENFKQLYTDSMITFGGIQAAKLFAQKSSAPVYFYLFSYLGSVSHISKPDSTEPLGLVAHHDDLLYLFHVSRVAPKLNGTEADVKMVQTLTSIWTEFANTGVPVLPDTSFKWPALTSTQQHYLNISSTLDIIPGIPFTRRMSVWESLFPISGPHQSYY